MKYIDNYINNYINLYKYIEPLNDDEPDAERRYTISKLYKFLERYINASFIEIDRINESNNMLDKISNKHITNNKDKKVITTLFCDSHFLIISLEKCYQLIIELFNLLDEINKSNEIRSSSNFIKVKRMRNSIEHMNENLLDDKIKSQKYFDFNTIGHNWLSSQLSTISDNSITIKDYTLNLSQESLDILLLYYSTINDIINTKYVIPNKELVDKLFR